MGEQAMHTLSSRSLGDVLVQISETQRRLTAEMEGVFRWFQVEVLQAMEKKVKLDEEYMDGSRRVYELEVRNQAEALEKQLRRGTFRDSLENSEYMQYLRQSQQEILKEEERRYRFLAEKHCGLSQSLLFLINKVMFEFRRSGRLELSLKTGDVIFLLRRVNADWLEGTVNNQTGIFPESFVKVIKPLPEDEGGVATSASSYSCLRCHMLTPSGVDTRDVCVEEDITIQPSYSDLLDRMRDIFNMADIALNYRDPEGDLIRMLDDEDIGLMTREGRRQARSRAQRPVNQFPWELHVTLTSDLSAYATEG
ncbi:unnamed protein product [Boreogadus saida]